MSKIQLLINAIEIKYSQVQRSAWMNGKPNNVIYITITTAYQNAPLIITNQYLVLSDSVEGGANSLAFSLGCIHLANKRTSVH